MKIIYLNLFIFSLFALNKNSFAGILVLSNDSNKNDFYSYIELTDDLSYSDFLLNEYKKQSSSYEELLQTSEFILSKPTTDSKSQIQDLQFKIKEIQKNYFLTSADRELFFEVFEKKLSQNLSKLDNQFYLSKLCWSLANDQNLSLSKSQFKDYCQYKKISSKSFFPYLNDFHYFISDGNVFDLKTEFILKYNNVPQQIKVLSDKKQPIEYYGTIDDFASNLNKLSSDNYLVTGSCENFKTQKNSSAENTPFSIFFSKNCIKKMENITTWGKINTFLSENKYALLTGVILSLLTYDYLKDKTIKFNDDNHFSSTNRLYLHF